MSAHYLFGEYSVKTLYLSHHKSAQHKRFLALMGIPPMLTLWKTFGQGGMDQRIFGQSTVALPEKPKRQLPVEALWVSGQYNHKECVHDRITKEHLQKLAQCINESDSIAVY